MYQLQNYIAGNWILGEGDETVLYNAITAEPIATATSKGIDMAAAVEYARKNGNPALRKMTFQQRALMLKALALYLQNNLEKLYAISYQTGATKADS
ncbi:MAG: phenylacetic acid degradation bifunctional protein PaaZ, partial [Chitinophagaceae bacterium]